MFYPTRFEVVATIINIPLRNNKMKVILTSLFLLFTFLPSIGVASDRYSATFWDICSTLKVDANKITFKISSEGIAECHNLENGNGEIYFNPECFDKFPINFFVGVMCHELGHFANKDKQGCETSAEGKADVAAGYSMRLLGFDINSAQLYLKIYSDASLKCYPSQGDREAFVRQGWDSLDKAIVKKNSYNQLVPRITWKISNDYSLIINMGERQLSYSRWMKRGDVVLLYDSITTTTIQLFEYKYQIGARGLGRVVTSQGLYCYFVYPKKIKSGYNFQIYYKGQIVSIDRCSQENEKDSEDLIVHCQDRDRGNIEVGFRLVDYYIAPDNYVLPAIYQ